MAITTKLMPIVPANEGNGAATIMRFPVSAAQTIKQGDILYMIAGGTVTRSPGTAVAEVNSIVGVAAEAKAAVATVAATDYVHVYAALPGQVFEGHLTYDATADFPATGAPNAAILAVQDNIFQPATDVASNLVYTLGTATTGTLAPCAILGYADSQIHDLTYYKTGNLAIATATTGAVANPRVKFVFKNSWFNPVAA